MIETDSARPASARPEFSRDQLDTLALPTGHGRELVEASAGVDRALAESAGSADDLRATLDTLRTASVLDLKKWANWPVFDTPSLLSWPDSLYIPQGANGLNFWPAPTPDDHRYGLDWTSPGPPNHASRVDGTAFAFAQVPWSAPAQDASAQAGVGIFYSPSFSLGVIHYEPDVNVTGLLTSSLQYFPTLSAGRVTLSASILLACWQVIPTGFDLMGFRSVAVESMTRDQSFGPERHQFSSTFAGGALSAPFVVQGGRSYLLGTVVAVSAASTLTSDTGRPLQGTSASNFIVYSWMSAVIPRMNVITARVDIP
ncbi:hypothetical protein [Subtercola sp. YIM 133946]|uniref:hypothetical protein n=1 Tax=Subtercola sp. YIM 133946 TaxID=3118909 RepID=UPI002F95DDC2